MQKIEQSYNNIQGFILAVLSINSLLYFVPIFGLAGQSGFKSIVSGVFVFFSLCIFLKYSTRKTLPIDINFGNTLNFILFLLVSVVCLEIIQNRMVPFFVSRMIWPFFLIIFSPRQLLARAFHYFRVIFALILIPSIVLYPLVVFLGDFSVGTVLPLHEGKVASGYYYSNYLFSYVIHEVRVLPMNFYRMTALFDEPGIIGTFSAFLLICSKFRKDWVNVTIVIGAVFSWSLAFYVLIVFYAFLRWPKLIPILIVFSVLIFNFYSDNALFRTTIVDRLQYGDSGFVGDNRTTSAFDVVFEHFYKSKEAWLGSKYSVYEYGYYVSSWKNLIWDYGIIGTALLLLFYLSSLMKFCRKEFLSYGFVVFVSTFFLSVYQRPYIFDISYFFVFACGLSFYVDSYSVKGKLKATTFRLGQS